MKNRKTDTNFDVRRNILGVEVNSLTMKETVEELRQLMATGTPHRHLAVNAAKIVEAYEHPDRARLFNEASVISADGQSVVWASRILGSPLPERVAGIDLMDNLVNLAIKEQYNIYLLGASEHVVQEVAVLLRERGANVVGYHNGFWRKTKSDSEMASEIAATSAHIVFVAVPSPMKEDFIAEQLESIGAPLCVGVGGSFDVIAGVVKRAPKIFQKAGMEWFYRFLQEPKRMFKRYLIGNSKFIFYVVKSRLHLGRY